MQYNDVAYDNHQQQHMYGHQDMNGSFMQGKLSWRFG